MPGLLDLVLRFLYVGFFTVGGGLAAIPHLLQVIVQPGLIDEDLFYNMIAISQSTPGPIGVNVATYIGFTEYGVIGGIAATMGMVLPCFVISSVVFKVYVKVTENRWVKAAFYGIRAAVAGLVSVAAWSVLKITVFSLDAFEISGLSFWAYMTQTANALLAIIHWKALAAFAVLFFLVVKFKKHPALYIALGALAGAFLL